MTLLIRHPQFLEAKKRDYGIFDNVPNELCIKAVCFSQASTDFCLAIPDEFTQQDDISHHTKHILGAAGKYTQLSDGKMSMTPKVIDDIQRRRLSDAWDKLAIIANCCQYNIRMDPRHMKEPKSLSISILAMCILNREILVNEPRKNRSSMLEKTMSQFLKEQAFGEFCAPESQRDLTFNKGCRFVDVEITPIGIKTKGHLWKLDKKIIDTSSFRLPLPEAKKGPCSVAENEQRCLAYLAAELRRLHETTLAKHIERFLNYDHTRPDENLKNEKFSMWYMRIMAEELAKAIEKGKRLRLGRIWDPITKNPCSAIFIWDSNGTENIDIKGKPYRRNNCSKRDRRTEFVFTASRPLERGFQQRGTNDLDHHVSLQVQRLSLWDKSPDDHPQLLIKRWLVGLCFFYDFPRTDVVFPWPSSFHTVGY